MTADEQERMQGLSSNNATLRLKLQAAEEENKLLAVLSNALDAMRAELFETKERLTRAHAILDAAGLLDQLLPATAPVEREADNDARTKQAERGFTR